MNRVERPILILAIALVTLLLAHECFTAITTPIHPEPPARSP
jgi:hypothetical protein